MDPVTITVSVISAVAGILTTYKTGREFYKKWRAKKKARKAAEEEVEDSLATGSSQIDNRCTQLSRRHGQAFDRGDDESRASLLRISLDLNQSLVDVLRSSLVSGRTDSIEPQNLWNASERAQKQTLRAMIDLSQRIQLSGPILRLLGGDQRSSSADASTLAMVLHPAQSRPTASPFIDATSLGIEDLTLSSTEESPLSTSPSSALSSFLAASSFHHACSSPFQSTPLLLPPIFPHSDGKTSSDLLQEWKEDLNARSPQLLLPSSPAMDVNFQSPRRNIRRFASTPITPSFKQASPRPDRRSVRSPETSPSLPELDTGLGIQELPVTRMTSHRIQSDSYVPSSLATTEGEMFPTTSIHKGFTHSLANNAGNPGGTWKSGNP